jgi:N-acetylneuraminic acid mutarotase
MAVPRRLLGAAVVDDRIYVFGGNSDDNDSDDKVWYTAAVECYDAGSDSWSRRKDLPHAGPCSAVAVGAYVFVLMHGRSVLRYCPGSDSYTALEELPLREWFCFDATACGTDLYVHGGAAAGVWSKAFYKYDTLTNTWEELPQMMKQRRRCAGAIIEGPSPPSTAEATTL